MDDKHLQQLACWIADNLTPIEREDMPLIFPKDEEAQERLWAEVCKLLRYDD